MSIMRGVLSITEYNVFSYITTVIGTKSAVGSNLGLVYAVSGMVYRFNKWYISSIYAESIIFPINYEHNSYTFPCYKWA